MGWKSDPNFVLGRKQPEIFVGKRLSGLIFPGKKKKKKKKSGPIFLWRKIPKYQENHLVIKILNGHKDGERKGRFFFSPHGFLFCSLAKVRITPVVTDFHRATDSVRSIFRYFARACVYVWVECACFFATACRIWRCGITRWCQHLSSWQFWFEFTSRSGSQSPQHLILGFPRPSVNDTEQQITWHALHLLFCRPK